MVGGLVDWLQENDKLAGWAQTLGALLTLAAMFWLARSAATQQERQSRAAVLAFAAQLQRLIAQISEACGTQEEGKVRDGFLQIAELKDACDAIRLDALDALLAVAYLRLRRRAALLCARGGPIIDGAQPPYPHLEREMKVAFDDVGEAVADSSGKGPMVKLRKWWR